MEPVRGRHRLGRVRPPRRYAVFLLGAVLLAACRPVASGPPISADEAARIVLGSDARFAGIGPRDPELIGQAAWYEVTSTTDGFEVTVRIGWGDCPAGCIYEHAWTYAVSGSGALSLESQSGDPYPAQASVRGTATAGPTCPVVTDPPDPSCAERPVEGAVLVVEDGAGREVARTTSASDGTFALELAPGAYRLLPQPVEGLLGTAAPIDFVLEVGQPILELAVSYDTGIR